VSRLFVLLALVLFGVPQGHSEGTPANAGPAAHSKVEQAQAIISAQRLVLRAQIVDDHLPDTATPGRITQPRQPRVATTMSYAPHPSFPSLAIRILPPVRGPPVV
jgi:hypothetical protein